MVIEYAAHVLIYSQDVAMMQGVWLLVRQGEGEREREERVTERDIVIIHCQLTSMNSQRSLVCTRIITTFTFKVCA